MRISLFVSALMAMTLSPACTQNNVIDEIEPANLLAEPEEAPAPNDEPLGEYEPLELESESIGLLPVTEETKEEMRRSFQNQGNQTELEDNSQSTEINRTYLKPVASEKPEMTEPVEEFTKTTATASPTGVLTTDEVIEEILESEKKKKPDSFETGVIPQTFGDTTGQAYLGHRSVVDRYAGWGWIKKEDSVWKRAQWAVIEEIPRKMPIPGRFLGNPNQDDNYQYKLYGEWANYKAYEPNYDVYVPVFQLTGFELIGKRSKPGGLRPPRGTSMSGRTSAFSGGGARNNPFSR
ncbi:MAG: hypothetical protein AAFY98_03375 [Verrucomicrobiota bacterium]